MGKPTFDQHNSMPDIVGSTDFRLTFSRVPGSLGIDLQKVSLNCTQAVIPGVTINKAEQRFAGGHKLNYALSSTFSGSFAVQFIERVDAQSLLMLRAWQEFVRGSQSGTSGGYKDDYAVKARLEVFDGPGNTVMEIDIINVFIQELPETQVDATAETQQLLYSCTFNYDMWQIVGQPLG